MNRLLVALVACALAAVALAGSDAAVSFPVVFAFMVCVPGLAMVAGMRLERISERLLLAVALSLAADAFVATFLLYAGLYTPRAFVGVLALVTVVAVGIVTRPRRSDVPTPPAPPA